MRGAVAKSSPGFFSETVRLSRNCPSGTSERIHQPVGIRPVLFFLPPSRRKAGPFIMRKQRTIFFQPVCWKIPGHPMRCHVADMAGWQSRMIGLFGINHFYLSLHGVPCTKGTFPCRPADGIRPPHTGHVFKIRCPFSSACPEPFRSMEGSMYLPPSRCPGPHSLRFTVQGDAVWKTVERDGHITG